MFQGGFESTALGTMVGGVACASVVALTERGVEEEGVAVAQEDVPHAAGGVERHGLGEGGVQPLHQVQLRRHAPRQARQPRRHHHAERLPQPLRHDTHQYTYISDI